ncbi:TonB-dependent siderophore receptor [Phreatobacter aquaticus]|uniref:TonB-dependent siderophore receptor n=1 Tax=Phreatobacter aquaticus TaxID=2570229 RepID=A0A4D7QK38_9HYPH|nr:TonB-dependent siderophore receptor [Phreatobacter aquaticus]QCK88050.1 TonB-dependent siderophore receptor [Phreatobacter aquaticus]
MSRTLLRALLASTALSALAPLSAAMAQQSQPTALPQVDVQSTQQDGAGTERTTAGPVQGIRATTSQSATKTQTPIEQVPISIQVIPRQLIDQQGALSQTEAFQNLAGFQALPVINYGQQNHKVRGFAAERLTDGLPNYFDAGARDLLVNVERVELLRGPQALLYSGGANAIGGVLNVISKLPTDRRFAEFGITAGGRSFYSPWFDINQPLNSEGTVLFRITGQFEGTRSNIDVLDRQSLSISPTLTFTNNTGTSLTVQGHYSRRAQQDYSGLPTVGTIDRSTISIRDTLFPGNPSVPKATSDLASLTMRFDHAFNETWSTFTTARIATSAFNEPSQGLVSNQPSAAPSTFDVYNLVVRERLNEVSLNSNLVGRFQTGPAQHRLLFGVDYNRVTERGGMWGDFVGTGVNYLNPVFPTYTESGPFWGTYIAANNAYRTMGATVQVQTSIWNRLHLLAGVRVANLQINDNDAAIAKTHESSNTRVLPRVGAALEVLPGFSLFAGYAEGMKPVTFYTGLAPAKPEESKQLEAGIKLHPGHGLSATIALFELTRRNVPTSVGFLSVQTGEQRSRGVEVDATWQPNRNWSFLASYAYVDAFLVRDGNAALVGQPLNAVPRNSGRLWANYKFTEGTLDGLSIGGGLYAASDQVVELGSAWRTPAFVTFDARVAYQYQNWTIALTGKNLADRRYFIPYPYFSGRVAPAEGRTAYLTVSTKF